MAATLHERVLRGASETPVLEQGDRTWSSTELSAEVDAWCLHIRRGDSFGWLGHNNVAMLAALLACSRVGARFVPLNWRLAPAELAAIAEHAGLTKLHGEPETAELADAVRAACTLSPAPAAGHQAGDLLLVYTSGTSGRPKAAVHTQAGLLANIDAAIDAQGFDANTRALAVLPLFHVGGLCIQTLPVLAAGGVVRLHARFDAGAWLNDVAAWRPTTSLLVPATMRAVIEHVSWPDADLSSLVFLNTGSQVVPRSLIDAFHRRGVPVCQVYGATETGPVSVVLKPHQSLANAGMAGWPALGVQVRVVAADGSTAQSGELWIQAANLMRGYHREPDDTAFAGGWFRTGDIGRQRADGCIEVVGRLKDMIVSGGENIYPAEIENLALEDPAVAEAAVVGVADERWGEVPVLALVLRDAGVDYAEIEQRLRVVFADRLARYKHPRRVVVVASLPKTALGKIKKAELAAKFDA